MKMAKVQKYSRHFLQIAAFVMMFVSFNAEEECFREEDAFVTRQNPDGSKLCLSAHFEQNEESELGRDNCLEIQKGLTAEKIQEQLDKNSNLKNEKDMIEKERLVTVAEGKIRPYYQSTCPEIYIWLRPGYYYWTFVTYGKDGSTIYSYCFNYWYVWMIECACNYCNLNYGSIPHYDRRFQCRVEHRYVWIPMVCYVVEVKDKKIIKKSWTKLEWRRVLLSRDCCCKRFYYYSHYAFSRCPAT
ncbi:uncharacterized protein LOC123549989 [Mercenaria mercenaria]|uniref:uncharacterized protein LOC123549989 n=1 Tax=Mercenaria mercenaria TaxID=6596 RepID=UPI001E1DC6C9|nr:uncharacterized protein LOC123549989 [Mercenaria mercenaria]